MYIQQLKLIVILICVCHCFVHLLDSADIVSFAYVTEGHRRGRVAIPIAAPTAC